MSSLRCKDPSFLRSCALYELYKGKSAFKAYENVCKVFGDDAMEYKEFLFWFARFVKGNDDLTCDHYKIAETLRNDQIKVRRCILYEVLNKQPVFDAYKSLCSKLGEDAIEYVDFEFWFYRFYNGKLDLDYDRSLDPTPLAFSELPIEIIGKFVEKLNLMNRIRIRKVSRLLRNIADTQKAVHTVLGFRVCGDEIKLQIEGSSIKYREQNSFENMDYVDRALHDLAVVLKNPKIQLYQFFVTFYENARYASRCLEFIVTTLKSRKSPLHVTFLYMEVYPIKKVMTVLPYLKAGTLEELGLKSFQQEENELNELLETNHWKMLKYVSLHGYFIPTPIDRFFRFNAFTIEIDTIPDGELIRLRDAASKSPNFDRCLLLSQKSEFHVAAGRIFGVAVQDPETRKIVHRHPIPNSKSFLETTIDTWRVLIMKKI